MFKLQIERTFWKISVIYAEDCSFSETTDPYNFKGEGYETWIRDLGRDHSRSERVIMVDRKSSTKQQKKTVSSSRSDDNIVKCIPSGLGCSLQRKKYRGTLKFRGKETPHKCVGIEGSQASNSYISKTISPSKVHPSSNGQCSSTVIHSKERRDKEVTDVRSKQGDLGLSSFERYHNYCGTPSRKVEQRSRYSVQVSKRLKRVESLSQDLSDNLSKKVDTFYRPFRFQAFSSGSNLPLFETRSIQSGQTTSKHLEG